MKVAVIGSGSWGTALAIKAVAGGNRTYLYCRNAQAAAEMRVSRQNKRYLPEASLPLELQISSDLVTVLAEADIILMVTPSPYVRETLRIMEPLLTKKMTVVVCSKGLERNTGKTMSEVMEECIGHITTRLAVLSGPNHAEEISLGLPAATVVASSSKDVCTLVQRALNSETFRIYANEDVTGVELAGTTKNIIALAAGIAHGMGLGDNTKAALLTRGLHEMTKFGIAYGAKRETYAGLAGMGDLIATCMSPHSRNRTAGQKLADGYSMDYIINHTNMVVEGFYAVDTVYKAACDKGIDMPITQALYGILYEHKNVRAALYELMTRELKDETYLM